MSTATGSKDEEVDDFFGGGPSALSAALDDDDEIAELKRQAAALAASTGVIRGVPKKKKDGKKGHKHKKNNMLGFWEDTTNKKDQDEPETPAYSAPRRKVKTFAPVNQTPVASNTSKSYEPSDTPPMGRPAGSPEKIMFGSKKEGAGEKWNPNSEIQGGSVNKFKDRFNKPEQQDFKHQASFSGIQTGGVSKYKDQFAHNQSFHADKTKSNWQPNKEIDNSKIDNIKNMWGAKASSNPAPAPYRPGKLNTSKWDKPKTDPKIPDLPIPPPGANKKVGGKETSKPPPADTPATVACPLGSSPANAANVVEMEEVDVNYDDSDEAASESSNPDGSEHKVEQGGGAATSAYAAIRGSVLDDTSSSDEEEEVVKEEPVDLDANVPSDDGPQSTEEVKAEIMMLVYEVLPGEVDNIEAMLDQFNGREEKLRDTLKGMQTKKSGSVSSGKGESKAGSVAASKTFKKKEVHDDESLTTLDKNDKEMTFSDMPNAQVANLAAVGADGSVSTADGSKDTKKTGAARGYWAQKDAESKSKAHAAPPQSKKAPPGSPAHSAAAASAADYTIESEESRHIQFSNAAGVAVEDKQKNESVANDKKDKFTGQEFVYNSSASPAASPVPGRKLSAVDRISQSKKKLLDDIEEGEQYGGGGAMPLVNANDVKHKSKKPQSESGMSFETMSIGVPSQIGVLKKTTGGAPTVVSEMYSPPPGPMRRSRSNTVPWYKNRRIQACGCCACLCIIIAAVVLGLFFGGVFGGGDEEQVEEPIPIVVKTPAPTVYTTPPPSLRPSARPSGAPSDAPISRCEASLLNDWTALGLGSSPNTYPPHVAMDGENAVVITNSGTVRFYKLKNGSNNEWDQVDYFPNLNRSKYTPAVAMSGRIVVVGFLYQVLGNNQGWGGAYIYEQDKKTGRWKRFDVLVPNEDIDQTARFGWAVAVDANQENPLVVIGAHGTNSRAGAVYVFEKEAKDDGKWSQVGKALPQSCPNGNFGYSVAVAKNRIAATTDCEFIVQINEYNRATKEISSYQNIRFISFDLGAIGALVMNERNLAYSTVFGGVIIFEQLMSDLYEFQEQLDESGNQAITSYPLALDDDILVVGVGNRYKVLTTGESNIWQEDSFYIENQNAVVSAPDVGVSGRNVMAGSGDPHDIFSWNVQACTDPMPTQSPTHTQTPTIFTSKPPTRRPTLRPTTAKPTPSPVVVVVEDGGCYDTVISILFDSSPFGSGYVLVKIEDSGSETSVDTFFPFDDSLVNQRYNKELCLEEGSYKFTMYDSYGDGLCCVNGNGEYLVTSNGIALAQGGEFGYNEETLFDLPATL